MTNKEFLAQLAEAIDAVLDERMARHARQRVAAVEAHHELLALQRRTAEALERIATLLEERMR